MRICRLVLLLSIRDIKCDGTVVCTVHNIVSAYQAQSAASFENSGLSSHSLTQNAQRCFCEHSTRNTELHERGRTIENCAATVTTHVPTKDCSLARLI